MYVYTVPLQVYVGKRIMKINKYVQKLWNFSQYLSNAPRSMWLLAIPFICLTITLSDIYIYTVMARKSAGS